MKVSSMAIKNVRRNYSFYSLYFFSVALVLAVFFCFVSFSMNEVILEKISSDGRVETMCRAVAVFVIAFVVFYMSYANQFFMRRRMKELGIYALLGYTKTRMLCLLTLENMLICAGGICAALPAGGLLHKGAVWGITAALGLAVDSSRIPLINLKAAAFCLLTVLAVLAALTLSNARLLWRSTLMETIRMERRTEKPFRIRPTAGVFGVLLLLAGYGLALDMGRGKASCWYRIGFSPIALLTMLLAVVGTALFILSFLPFVCNMFRDRKNIFYRENTIITVPKFMSRLRTNAKSLILLILLSGGTLAVFGATVLSVWYPLVSLERIIPSSMEFRVLDRGEKTAALEALDKTVGSGGYEFCETIVRKVKAASERLPAEYGISADKGREAGFECIRETDYESLRGLQGKKNNLPSLRTNECVLIKYRPDPSKRDIGAVYALETGGRRTCKVTVKDTSLENPIGFANSVGTLVVTDEVFEELGAGSAESYTVMSIGGRGLRTKKQAYEALRPILSGNPYFVSAFQRKSELIKLNSSTLLLISFAAAIFLIATGSILYFQTVSAAVYDRPDYEIMGRMGYNYDMIKRAVRSQVQIYFLVPFLMGTLHSVFALFCYKSALMDDLLGKSSAVLVPLLCAIGSYSLIYLIYYQVTKRACYRIILKEKGR
ncbi:FtsX-like permease family protein [Lactonifactor longoviformis]|uniref:FtsX-like permease family protein n=1 Tax=Lactonifactor longoviformis TaxID=341220 RepID=UPI0036F3FF6E